MLINYVVTANINRILLTALGAKSLPTVVGASHAVGYGILRSLRAKAPNRTPRTPCLMQLQRHPALAIVPYQVVNWIAQQIKPTQVDDVRVQSWRSSEHKAHVFWVSDPQRL